MRMRNGRSTNERRDRFMSEYRVDGNATQAAIRAGYKATAAKVTGSRLLAVPEIRAQVLVYKQARQTEASARAAAAGLSVARWREEVLDLARDDMQNSASRVRAYELLARSHGWLQDRHLVTSDTDLEARLLAARERARVSQVIDIAAVPPADAPPDVPPPTPPDNEQP